MAEFLPTTREHRHQQQREQPLQNQNQNQNHSKQRAKQTIEQDTNSFQVSSASTSKSFPEKDDKTTTITANANSSAKFKATFPSVKSREQEPLVVGGCVGGSGGGVVVVVGSGDIKIGKKKDEKQTRSSFVNDKTQFIDSRSILSNKAKLKKFWEHKMEMEFKLRQQQQQSAVKTNKQQQQQPVNSHQMAVESDENNNRGSNNNKHNNNNGNGDIDGHQKQQQQQQQQQVQCASDEEWRSLSPNVEPTTLNGPFNKSFTSAATKQVSVELICEKLREYQANNGELVDKRPTTNGHSKPSSVEQQDRSIRTSNESSSNNGLSKQVPNHSNNYNYNSNSIDSNNTSNSNNDNNNSISNCGHDETQLMSIDPTLCHSSGAESEGNNSNNNNNNNHGGYNFINMKSSLADSSSLAEDLASTYNKHREEQTVNEEFSSSSNSSFGPMSISLPREETLAKAGGEPPTTTIGNGLSSGAVVAKQANSISDEDDLSSAQSGSVLTVINKFDSADQKNQVLLSILDGKERDLTLSDLEKSSPFCNDITSIQSEQVTNSLTMPPRTVVSGSENIDNPEDDDPEESGSNIGVTFESLQFDNEIKSSKQEKVDDELLIAPIPVKRPVLPKFNAHEVKSVCHFITNAITDATRQVENYITGQASVTQQRQQQQRTNDGDMGSIQRATFVPHQLDMLDEPVVVNLKNESTNYVATNTDSNYDDNDSDNYANDVQQAVEDEGEIPSADLSSIFEANVQREIERFETHSTIKKSLGGKLADMNGLTKWRIAEEIRQFNEREMELKRRLEGNRKKDCNDLSVGNNNDKPQNELAKNELNSGYTNLELNAGMSLKSHQQHQQETAVTVVRFGKTLQIAKPSSPATSQDLSLNNNNNNNSLLPCKSIKLSTSSGASTNSSTISMHKFIASGGKRFVFTGTSSGFNGNVALQHQSHLTKSMSNLSTSNTKIEPQRTVDYKASDSLKSKETPNVKPGLTKKVIETFSRLNHKSRFDSHQSLAPSALRHQQSSTNSSQQALNCQHQGANGAPSAEWKIQEELREMRAREAELRSQRNHLAQRTGDMGLASPSTSVQPRLEGPMDSADVANSRLKSEDEQIRAIDRSLVGSSQNHLSPSATSIDGQSSFSNESLYPIKQTIDSFKKLNSSSQTNHNGTTMMAQQNIGPMSGNQRRKQATDDYVSD